MRRVFLDTPHAQTLALALGIGFMTGCGGGGSAASAPPASATTPPDAAQMAWLRQSIVPIASVDPTAPETDLTFFGPMVGNASVIGLGEATHGSSEFQKMKDRLFRYLVEQDGVVAFGLEAQMGRCLAIDQYLATGQGDPAHLMAQQGFWVWSTQEMVDLVTWMRAWNADPTHTQRLRFFGFDLQDGGNEIGQVLAYLGTVDPQAQANLTNLYALYRPFTWGGAQALTYDQASSSVRAQCHANVQEAWQWMSDHQASYSAASGVPAYAWALQMSRVVVQNEAMSRENPNSPTVLNLRDQFMAENAEWYARNILAGEKLVLSAHNEHINKGGLDPTVKNLGQWLHADLGASYCSVGFGFGSGGLNAHLVNPDGTVGSLQVNTVAPEAAGSYEDAFIRAGVPIGLLDMRSLNPSQTGPDWFCREHPLREVGADWNQNPGFGVHPSILPNRFDLFIFVNRVTPTTILPGWGH